MFVRFYKFTFLSSLFRPRCYGNNEMNSLSPDSVSTLLFGVGNTDVEKEWDKSYLTSKASDIGS